MKELKILPHYYKAVVRGDKTFELRNNDRNFVVGEEILLREWDYFDYTGNNVRVKITYILDIAQFLDISIPYVIFSFKII